MIKIIIHTYSAGLFQILPEEVKRGVRLTQPMGIESLHSPDTFFLEGEEEDVSRVKLAIDDKAKKWVYGD